VFLLLTSFSLPLLSPAQKVHGARCAVLNFENMDRMDSGSMDSTMDRMDSTPLKLGKPPAKRLRPHADNASKKRPTLADGIVTDAAVTCVEHQATAAAVVAAAASLAADAANATAAGAIEAAAAATVAAGAIDGNEYIDESWLDGEAYEDSGDNGSSSSRAGVTAPSPYDKQRAAALKKKIATLKHKDARKQLSAVFQTACSGLKSMSDGMEVVKKSLQKCYEIVQNQ
jgi:hypothetical protein